MQLSAEYIVGSARVAGISGAAQSAQRTLFGRFGGAVGEFTTVARRLGRQVTDALLDKVESIRHITIHPTNALSCASVPERNQALPLPCNANLACER
jgi:hypothetical protein